MRKVLYLQWDCFCEEYICDSLQREGFVVEKYPIPYGKKSMRHDDAFETELKVHLSAIPYEFVYSFNFFPTVALACHSANVTYISWTYDSPFMYLYSETIKLPTNLAFVFDKATVEELRNKDVTNVHYMPMAAPVTYYDSLCSSLAQCKNYQSEVAFVGSLYTEARQDLMSHLQNVNPAVMQYLDMLIEMQLQSYAMPILERFLKPEILIELQKACPIELDADEMQSLEWMYANYYLARQATARERMMLLGEIGNRHELKLYTPDPTQKVSNAINMGPVDYCNTMPYVFKNAKINLNISLKSIYSGIPLRAFDIMGCGGFLISDFQSDFGDVFIADEDYVFYTTPDDLYAKVAYYLQHEEKRKSIALSGYEKVKEKHTYDHRLKEMLNKL